MGRDQLNEIIEIVKGDVTFTKGDSKTATMHYKYRKDFAVMKFGEHFSLVRSKDVVGKTVVDISTVPRYVCYEELYDAIRECHIDQEGHSGIRKTESSTRKHYVNVSRTMCEKFIAACSCQLDRKHPAKSDDIKPIISSSFNSRGQVDLINMTAYKDGPYQWILHYQDHHDKMSYLCAMEDKKPKTVAFHLLPLFLQQGAPLILQSDNGREFVAKVIEELLKTWKECKIVHGSPRHPQSQGSVERANVDIETMVTQWMKDENSTKWSWGIHFIAHKKNNRYH